MTYRNLIFSLAAGLFAASCSSGGLAAGSRCASTSQCKSGLFCLSDTGTCAQVSCTLASDCPGGVACSNGACGVNNNNNNGAGSIPTITSVTVDAASGTFTVSGTHLEAVTSVQVSGGSLTAPAALTPSGITTSQLIATLQQSLPLVVGQAYNLIVATASAASAPAAITYTIPNGTVTPAMLNVPAPGCPNGDVLTVAAGAWTCASAAAQAPAPPLDLFSQNYDSAAVPALKIKNASTTGHALEVHGLSDFSDGKVKLPVYIKGNYSPTSPFTISCDGNDIPLGGGCDSVTGAKYLTYNRPSASGSTVAAPLPPGSGWMCGSKNVSDGSVADVDGYVICLRQP